MHVPEFFRPSSQDQTFDAMENFPFATVASACPAGSAPFITHLPLLLDRGRGAHGTLVGHIARANPHTSLLREGAPTVAVFHGPHGYVTPTWYRQEPSLPTWNYVAIHATGTPALVDDGTHLRTLLTRTVNYFETRGGGNRPWPLDTDTTYVVGYAKAIVAFEIPIVALEGAFKLSQNIEEPLRSRVVEGLRRRDRCADQSLADAMDAQAPSAPHD